MSEYELDLFDQVAMTASTMPKVAFTEPDDDWVPVLFLEDAEGQRSTMPIEQFMQNERTKDLLADFIIPQAIKHFEAKTVVMVMSVWHATLPEGITDPADYARPSEALNREEAVMIIEYTAEGISRYTQAQIIRHEDAPPELGEWETVGDYLGTEGRFVGPIVAAMKRV